MDSSGSTSGKLLQGLTAIALVAATIAFVITRFWYYDFTYNRDRAYAAVQIFGENCQIAVSEWQTGDDFSGVLARQHTTTPLAMPYRNAATKPSVDEGQYLYTRCVVDASNLAMAGFGWMRLHQVIGDSAVFLDGKMKLAIDDNGDAEFPLLPNERHAALKLEIVSRPTALTNGLLGLATGMPIFLTDSRQSLVEPNLHANFDLILKPIYWVNFSLALLLIFGSAWVFGLRRRENGWMIVALSLNVVSLFPLFAPDNTVPTIWVQTHFVLVFARNLAFAGFALTFLRYNGRRPWDVFAFLAFSAVYSVLVFGQWLPTDWLYRSIPWFLNVGLFGAISAFGLMRYRKVTEDRRWYLFILSYVCLYTGVQILNLAVYYTSFQSYSGPLNELMVMGFSLTLGLDYVVFRHRYQSEKVTRLQIEQEALELRAVAQTTQMLAHDVRKPFSMLKTMVAVLSKTRDPAKIERLVTEFAKGTQKHIDAINSMLSDVMDMGRPNLPSVTRESADSLIEAAVMHVFGDEREFVKIDCAADVCVQVDRQKIIRVLTNLVDNAKAAATLGTTVSISARTVEDGAVFSVHNQGDPIPLHHMTELFKPFFTKGKAEGTGLGLAIVQKFIRLHGGRVVCRSAPGFGTEFTVFLPTIVQQLAPL